VFFMKLGVLFSGGKDSCLALHKVLEDGHNVKFLLNIFTKNQDSFMFHKQDAGLLAAQVDRLGIEMISVNSEGVEEEELKDLEALIGKVSGDVDGIAVGGIASSYQSTRVKAVCDKFGLEFVGPLLDYEPEKLWTELLGEGFEVIVIKIACDGIGKGWLGRVITKKNFDELRKLSEKYKFRLDFEGGEAETAVLMMPEYSKRIDTLSGHKNLQAGIDFEVESEGEYRHLMKEVKVL